jgi:hypothetical protein
MFVLSITHAILKTKLAVCHFFVLEDYNFKIIIYLRS